MVNNTRRASLNGANGHSPGSSSSSTSNGNGNGGGQTHSNGNGNSNGNGHRSTLTVSTPARANRNSLRYANIVGWGMKIPDTVITNADLEAVVDTTDEWIRSRTGIQERRFASEREGVVNMGFEAARIALDRADILPTEIDLIIVATSTPEDIYPSTACKIQNILGATKAGAFDLSAACSGFVYALNMASQAIRSGSIDKALVIGTEVNSRVMDWNDRSTCILFGDGAGAVVLSGGDDPGGMLSCVLGADGSGADLLGIPTVGRASIPEGQQMHKLHMNGREVFRFATHVIHESIIEAVEKAGLKLADIALIVPHQANQRILSAAARSLNVPESLFYSNVHRYGNTSAASIPIALCEAEREGRIHPGDNIILIGFGGGLTWATAVIQWQPVPAPASRGLNYRLSQGRREVVYVFAFWRARFMQMFRRWEAKIKGSPALTANIREPKKSERERERDRERSATPPAPKRELNGSSPKAEKPEPEKELERR
ncbi:MAG: ketoacyl-ACP synthase III [Anaerolineae bacterium]|nr:ketoacyl-ACP synthase III [Anaerolineae bacterium]